MLSEVGKQKRFFLGALALLFLSFAFNFFSALSNEQFVLNFKDSESLVSNQILCKGSVLGGQLLASKTEKLIAECEEKELKPYSSQYGFHGRVLSKIYSSLLGVAPSFRPTMFIKISQLFMALLSALMIAILAVYTRARFGIGASLSLVGLSAVSPMMVGFGRNLYWALPLLLLPFVFCFCFYAKNAYPLRRLFFWGTLFIIFVVKYLSGYEYLTTITIMAFAGIAYHHCLPKVNIKKLIIVFIYTASLSVAAFSLSLVIHLASLRSYGGSWRYAVDKVKDRAVERTLDAGAYKSFPFENLKQTIPQVYPIADTYLNLEVHKRNSDIFESSIVAIANYVLLPVFSLAILPPSLFTSFLQSYLVFIVGLCVIWHYKWLMKKRIQEVNALFTILAIGIAAYLSWLIFGFSHSLVHAHVNGILMYMPFAMIGYMIIGMFIEALVIRRKNLHGQV